MERAQPHNTRHASLVSKQNLILPLIRILCDGTNHHGGGRPPRDLGTRESRGFKAECHLFPVFFSVPRSGRDHLLLHRLAWYQMTTVNESPAEVILYVHDPSAQILPGLHDELQIAPEVPDEPTRARRYSALLDG